MRRALADRSERSVRVDEGRNLLSAIPLKRTNSRKMRLGHLRTISGGICSIGFENDCRCIPDLVFFEVHFVK